MQGHINNWLVRRYKKIGYYIARVVMSVKYKHGKKKLAVKFNQYVIEWDAFKCVKYYNLLHNIYEILWMDDW